MYSPNNKRKTDDDIAYIHDVSPKRKTSRCTWYEMFVQTKDEPNKRILGYNIRAYGDLQKFAKQKSPVKLSTTLYKDAATFNDTCSVYELDPSDVPFSYQEIKNDFEKNRDVESMEASIEAIKAMEPNQWVPLTVRATITIGKDDYKEVTTKYGVSCLKKDCTLHDKTGTLPCRLWMSVAEQVVSMKTYEITELYLKSFMGNLYLVSSKSTCIIEIEQEIEKIEVISTIIGPVYLEDFNAVKNVNRFFHCLSYKKKIAVVGVN